MIILRNKIKRNNKVDKWDFFSVDWPAMLTTGLWDQVCGINQNFLETRLWLHQRQFRDTWDKGWVAVVQDIIRTSPINEQPLLPWSFIPNIAFPLELQWWHMLFIYLLIYFFVHYVLCSDWLLTFPITLFCTMSTVQSQLCPVIFSFYYTGLWGFEQERKAWKVCSDGFSIL